MILLVKFVSEADEGEVVWIGWASILDETLLPLVKAVETVQVCEVVHKCAAISTPVERISEGLELLLASGVPYLESDDGVVDENFLL